MSDGRYRKHGKTFDAIKFDEFTRSRAESEPVTVASVYAAISKVHRFGGRQGGRATEFTETMRLIAKIKRQNPRPICAKCGKVVDEFTLDTTPSDLFFHFTAHCHGKAQHFDIHKGNIMYADDITIGRAFEDEAAPTMRIDFDSRLLETAKGEGNGTENA